jgi:ribonuclease HI
MQAGGVLIRQNGHSTWNYGHYDPAMNNAMELRAVIKALRALPSEMYAWISTDSADVKKGIKE